MTELCRWWKPSLLRSLNWSGKLSRESYGCNPRDHRQSLLGDNQSCLLRDHQQHLPWGFGTTCCASSGAPGGSQQHQLYLQLCLQRDPRGGGPGLPTTPPGGPPEFFHWLTELLDATFDGAPEKLAFFVVRVQKFVMNWGHLFQNDEQQVDYVASRLCYGAADWVKRGPPKMHTDTLARKSTTHPKTQRTLQMNYPEEDPGLSKDTEDEQMGKGQDLL
ncbi:UNVERIFIED_CONTAM: hypothetical protein K2H54_033848 [Gekko kuhli]